MCFKAVAPSNTITLGFTSSICRFRQGMHSAGLFGARVTVLRRTALHDVGDEHVAIRVETDGAHDFVEELTSTPDESEALLVFVLTRTLTDHHDVGGRISAIDHDVRAPLVQRTLGAAAVTELFFELRVARRAEDRIATRVEEIELHGSAGVYQDRYSAFGSNRALPVSDGCAWDHHTASCRRVTATRGAASRCGHPSSTAPRAQSDRLDQLVSRPALLKIVVVGF